LSKEQVEWRKFATAFDDFLCLPNDDEVEEADMDRMNLNLRCLKAILAEPVGKAANRSNQKFFVKLESFGDFAMWFGPILIPKNPKTDPTILDSVRKLMECPWFYGKINTDSSEEKLTGRKDGTFLIRFSSQVGWFTVSVVVEGEVVHKRINHSPGTGYTIGKETYDSLFDLVKANKLTTPCGSILYPILHDKAPNYQ